MDEISYQRLIEPSVQQVSSGTAAPRHPNHEALSAVIRAQYDASGQQEVFIDDFDALQREAGGPMGENGGRYYLLHADANTWDLFHVVDPDGKRMVPGHQFNQEQMTEICSGLNTAFRDGLAAGRRSVPDAISWADVEMLRHAANASASGDQRGTERFQDLADRLAALLPPQRR
jgi:hypothetical protein